MTITLIWILLLASAYFLSRFVCRLTPQEFNERFPPISDEEFLARCRPDTNPQIALKVRHIMSNSLGVDYERIYPSSRLVEDLGAD